MLASQFLLLSRAKTFEVRSRQLTPASRPGHSWASRSAPSASRLRLSFTAAPSAVDMERMTIAHEHRSGCSRGMIAPENKLEIPSRAEFAPKGAAFDKRRVGGRPRRRALYDATRTLDANALEPMITYGTTPALPCPQQSAARAADFAATRIAPHSKGVALHGARARPAAPRSR